MASIQLSSRLWSSAFLKNFADIEFCHVRVNVSLSESMLDLTLCESGSGRDFKLCRRPAILKEVKENHCNLSGVTL